MGTADADYEIGAACLIPHSLLWFPRLLLWCSRYQLIVAPVKAMSALAAAAPVVVVAVVANSISGVDSNIYT
ncbi:hypothetical protein LB507_005895, partial [Fusarium sp. FIESC RH6]